MSTLIEHQLSCLSEFQYLSVLNVTRLMVLEIGELWEIYFLAFGSPSADDLGQSGFDDHNFCTSS